MSNELAPTEGLNGKAKWRRFFISLPVLILLAFLLYKASYQIAAGLGIAPSDRVELGHTMPEGQVLKLRKAGLLEQDADLYRFYSPAVWSLLEEGVILAKHKISYYQKQGDSYVSDSALISNIATAEIVHQGNKEEHTVVKVLRKDGSSFLFPLSTVDDRDAEFMKMLGNLLRYAN